MRISFDYEEDLVIAFINNYSKVKKEIVVKEMTIRFGNIDVVSIKNTELPFSTDQIKILSKPSNALVFTTIKNERPISKEKLSKSIGLSDSTINSVLYELLKYNLITKQGSNYLRESNFVFPKTAITGYEAKLRDFNKAFYQAKCNKEYVDYSYLVFPDNLAEKILKNKLELLITNGIGLIGVSEKQNDVLLKAKKIKGINNYIRLLNITKANIMQIHKLENMVG